MYDNLLTIFEKPSLYKKMEIPFWDDEHISLQMLKAHLNPEFNGASRKLDFINKSADWITRIVRPSEFNELLEEKNFNYSNPDVVEKGLELEKEMFKNFQN